MKKLLLTIMAISCFSLMAQPDITASDYEFGKLTRIRYMSSIDVINPNPVPPGPNVTWDFSDLVPYSDEDSITYEYVGTSSAYSSNFATSNEVVKRTNHGMGNTIFEHYFRSSTELSYLGFANPGGNYLKKLGSKNQQMKFPLKYGDSFSLNFTDTGKNLTHKVKYDAYGTLKLPSGTYTNVFRTVTRDSTIFNNASYTYRWFDGDKLLLTYFVAGLYSDIEYYEPYGNSTLISEQNIPAMIKIYPNPAKGLFHLNVNSKGNNIRLVVTNVFGQVIMEDILDKTQHDFEIANPGCYFVNVHIGDAIITEKIVVQ